MNVNVAYSKRVDITNNDGKKTGGTTLRHINLTISGDNVMVEAVLEKLKELEYGRS